MTTADPALGRAGERAAARWLQRRGFRIPARNLRVGRDEADLVAEDPDDHAIVIIEIKTRRSDAATTPAAHVNARKIRSLSRLGARLWQQPEYRDRAFRFDVITVVVRSYRAPPEIEHLRGAFESSA